MSEPKELRFFWKDDWRERLDWYQSHFDADATVRGESSPSYTHHPWRPHVPERIHTVSPDARLIYLVRDPIERMVSEWVHRYSLGEREPFADRMLAWRPTDPIVCGSLYATQAEQYLKFFDRSRLLVLDQADLRARRRETVAEVFSFLGVDPDFWSPKFEPERNARDDQRAGSSRSEFVWSRMVRPVVRRLPPGWRKPVRRRVRRVLMDEVESPTVGAEVRLAVEPKLADEVARLRALTGRPFANWSV